MIIAKLYLELLLAKALLTQITYEIKPWKLVRKKLKELKQHISKIQLHIYHVKLSCCPDQSERTVSSGARMCMNDI